jgi:hypothetical protein
LHNVKAAGRLDDRHREFVAVCEICSPRKHLAAYRWIGNPPSAGPPKDRLALCKAFIAKAVWNFPTTSATLPRRPFPAWTPIT